MGTVNCEDEEWEDIDSDVDSNDEPILKPKDAREKKKTQKIYKLRRAQVLDTDELLLPSGKIAGHRKFKHIYKQRPIIHSEEPYKMLESKSKVCRGNSYATAVVKAQMGNQNAVILQSDINRWYAKQNHNINKKLKKYRRTRDTGYLKLGLQANDTSRKYYVDRTAHLC